MNLLSSISRAAAALAVVLAAPAAVPAQEKTTLSILLDGKKSGTETVVRDVPDKGTFRDTARVEFRTPAGRDIAIDCVLTLRENEEGLGVARFTLDSKSGDPPMSVDLAFEGGRARGTLRQGGQEKPVDIEVGPGVTLLENNVFHLYRSLFRRYNITKAGLQTAPVFIPSAATRLEAQMERKGTARVKREGPAETVERVTVTLGDMTFDLYGTRGGRLLFLVSEEMAMRVATPGYEDAVVTDIPAK
jgi:hypothetical protein